MLNCIKLTDKSRFDFFGNVVCLPGSSPDAGIHSEGGFVTSLPGKMFSRAASGPSQSLWLPGGGECGSLTLAKEAMQLFVLLLHFLLLQTGQSNRFSLRISANMSINSVAPSSVEAERNINQDC